MTTKWDINKWVEQQGAVPHIQGFYPSLPANELQIEILDVIERLQYMVQDSCLNAKVEVRCPDCLSTVYCGDANKCPSEMHCHRCDIAFGVDADDIVPFYVFTDDFKQAMKKQNNKVKKKTRYAQ